MSTDGGRKCTICRQSGHNRQTCPVAADTGHWLTRSGIRLLLTFLTCLENVLMISMWCCRPMNEVVVVICKVDQSLRKLIRQRDRSPEWFRKCEQGFWTRKLFKGGFFSHGGFLNRIIPNDGHQNPKEARGKHSLDTGGKNSFVWIAKPMQNFPHLLSMWSNLWAEQIPSQTLSLWKNMWRTINKTHI